MRNYSESDEHQAEAGLKQEPDQTVSRVNVTPVAMMCVIKTFSSSFFFASVCKSSRSIRAKGRFVLSRVVNIK